jgi:hypothetical protein
MTTAKSATLLIALCACSDGGNGTPKDAPVDVDNGTCGSQLRFTGEFVDWDSGSTFCGVFGASFQARGASDKKSTAPNGRFDMCLTDQAVVLVDITPPTDASQCAQPAGSYALPAIAVASKAVIQAGGFWSGRAFVTARQTIDPSKAQVFVHIDGTPREVSIAASHGATQALTNGTWAAGTSGSDVFFPDVDPATGTTTVTTTGNAIGTGSIPLEAGKLTELSIITN